MYKYLNEVETPKELIRERLMEWRQDYAMVRLDKPTRLVRARTLGYRAKKGFIVVRVRVRRGGRRKARPSSARRQRHMGSKLYTPHKSMLLIAQERVARKFPNLRVLNGYWVGEDGQNKWFDIILVDPNYPTIFKDKRINWICKSSMKGRVYRGLTSAGKKVRGLRV